MSAGIEQRILRDIATSTGDDELTESVPFEQQPVYKVYNDTRIPISKKAGTLWRSRRDAATRKLEQSGRIANWEEAIRYYKNDQRTGRVGQAARTRADKGRTNRESENIVFANTSSLVPAIYAKNPSCEVTANYRDNNEEGGADDQLRATSTVAERLVNVILNKKGAPGVNLKSKARKAVVMSTLTNIAYLEIGYTFRDQSSEQALQDLDRIAQQMAVATDTKDIEELEGQLEALEEKVSFLNPSGPKVNFRHPKDVLVDPDNEGDIQDARWLMVADYLSTQYINAMYRMKQGEEWRSLYKPTHVVSAGDGKGVQEEINTFSLLKGRTDYRSFGFDDEDSFNKATRTKVWRVWDRTTRRVYLFSDDDWKWPIWVWDDPYNLETFFPIYSIQFYTDPEDDIGQSEVMYYLDQQDAINEVNEEYRKIRKRIMGTLFYNKSVIKDASIIDAYMKGEDKDRAVGVDAPPDANLNQALFSLVPPSVNYVQLLNKDFYYGPIQKVSSVQPVMQGEQFKTNTTNEAIETYNSTQQTRLDEKIDAVEDLIGDVSWGIMQLCLQFMTQEEVGALLGEDDGAKWQNFTPPEIRTRFSVRVVGGSSQKPTSKIKKQEAVQMAQALGQFAQAGQGAVVLMMLKVMERAFDELTITEEDWKFLQATIMQSVQNSNPTGAEGAAGPGGPGGAPGQEAPPTGSPDALLQQVATVIDQLPPQAKAALGKAMEQGVPVMEAFPRIMEMAQGMVEQ